MTVLSKFDKLCKQYYKFKFKYIHHSNMTLQVGGKWQVNLCLIFKETIKLFSKVPIPLYNSTNV